MKKTSGIDELYRALIDSERIYKSIVENGYNILSMQNYIIETDTNADIDTLPKLSDIVTIFANECVDKTENLADVNKNLIHSGDNLEYICYLIREKNMAGAVKLIYIDPPFFTHENYGAVFSVNSKKTGKLPMMKQQAFKDVWNKSKYDYFLMLAVRIMLMRDLLSDDGSIFIHLDWHVVHHVRLLMDEIFGEERFINEIIWNYKSGGVSNKYFARKHDNILFYSKNKNYYFVPQKEKSYNRGYKPYRFKGVEEFEDELGWYTLVNRKDVWQLDMVGRSSRERVNYATQKPEAVIRRIMESCTQKGDICADFFCGSGTLAAAASGMQRRFICCDSSRLAISNTIKRIAKSHDSFIVSEQTEKYDNLSSASLTAEYDGSQIRLICYSVDLDEIRLESKFIKPAADALEVDSLAFIDFWCVGTTSSSGVSNDAASDAAQIFKPEVFVFKEAGKNLDSAILHDNHDRESLPVVWAYDVFGNRIIAEVHRV